MAWLLLAYLVGVIFTALILAWFAQDGATPDVRQGALLVVALAVVWPVLWLYLALATAVGAWRRMRY